MSQEAIIAALIPLACCKGCYQLSDMPQKVMFMLTGATRGMSKLAEALSHSESGIRL